MEKLQAVRIADRTGAAPFPMNDWALARLEEIERVVDGWRRRSPGAAARWALRAFPRGAGSVLEVAAAGFVPAPIPHFYSTEVRQIDPTLNDDLLDLYGRARQIISNRFAFFNRAEAFEKGIDWEPHQSPSWRAELHACDYVLELACTFRISGEGVYARHLRYLIAHWVACNPPGWGSGWQVHVLARRVRNWMLAADFARQDWERDAEFNRLAVGSLALQTAFLLTQLDSLPAGTARFDASRALLCASRFFNGSLARQSWQRGFDLLVQELKSPLAEPWPPGRVSKAETLMEWNLLSATGEGTDVLIQGLSVALDELEAVLMPDATLPLWGPNGRQSHNRFANLAALAAVKFANPVWKSLAGNFGIVPYLLLGESGKKRFEGLNHVEWIPKDELGATNQLLRMVGGKGSALAVSARLPRSPKEHQDFMSYELTLEHQSVVVDSGGFAPEETEYFPHARAHNLLRVDGFEPQWGEEVTWRSIEWKSSSEWTRLRLTDPGFEFLGLRHERMWFRIGDDNWLILDWVDGKGRYNITTLTHCYPTFDAIPEGNRILLRSRARRIALIPVGNDKPTPEVSRGEHLQNPGWYSPEFGVKFPTAVLALNWNRVELPWMGGCLITPCENPQFWQVESDSFAGRLRLELLGKTYDISIK